MPEINLLPEELRKKEEKERARKKEKPEIKMVVPRVESSSFEKKQKMPSSWLFTLKSLFKKEPKARSLPLKVEAPVISSGTQNKIKKLERPSLYFTSEEKEQKLSWWQKFLKNREEKIKQKVKEKALRAKLREEAHKRQEAQVAVKAREKRVVLEAKMAQEEQEKLKKKVAERLKEIKVKMAPQESFDKIKGKRATREEPLIKQFSSPEKIKQKFIDVNLIPKEILKSNQSLLALILFLLEHFTFLVLIIVIGFYLGIGWYQFKTASQVGVINQQIRDLNQEIIIWQENKIEKELLEKQFKDLTQLLENHLYWTKFLGFLERSTLSQVYYNNFSASEKGGIKLQMIVSDFPAAASQLEIFRRNNKFIQEVKANSAQMSKSEKGGQEVNLALELFLTQDFFKR